MDIYKQSIEVILKNQAPSGAYIASPNFPNYHFCWLRDGSFIAYSMDVAGEFNSAERFYRWVGKVVDRYTEKVDLLSDQVMRGEKPNDKGILNTRFTLEGYEEGDNGWGNFQVDGYGSWLWGLVEHIKLTKDQNLVTDLEKAIFTTLQYLKLVWELPNYDCWEEYPEFLHPYSLATTIGGLEAVVWLQKNGFIDLQVQDLAIWISEIKTFILDNAVASGKFTKHILPNGGAKSYRPDMKSGVDASLLGITLPYNVFSVDNPIVAATVTAIEKDLWREGGGVYRYKADVYYGGGEWILLSAWLGWYFCRVGALKKAERIKAWIEEQALENGELPEQVNENPLSPADFQPWVEKWGSIAVPLLWSHAMYIILVDELNKAQNK